MGAYGLVYDANKVPPPESWSVLWEEKSKGRYTVSRDYAVLWRNALESRRLNLGK